jgi:hypothetical protein
MSDTIGANFAFKARAFNAFVFFSVERFHNSNRGQHLLDHRDDFSFLVPNISGRLFDSTRVGVHNQKEGRCDRECYQRESPVEVQHHPDHAHQGDRIDQRPQQTRRYKTLNGVDVTRDTADQITRAFLVMERERQSLNVGIERTSQVVRHPLRNACSQILLNVGANCVQRCDGENPNAGKLQHRHLVGTGEVCQNVTKPALHGLALKKAIEHNLQRPRLQQVGHAFACNGNQADCKGLPMRTEQLPH